MTRKGGRNARAGSGRRPAGLTDAQINSLFDRLDRVTKGEDPRRSFTRWSYRLMNAELSIEHPGGSRTGVPVACRNLSCGGAGVIHSSFVYPGSRCVLQLTTPTGHQNEVHGAVVRCNHVEGIVHELGVKFDEEIEIGAYTGADPIAGAFRHESVDPELLEGCILSIESSELDQRLVSHYLKDTHVRLRTAEEADEAIKLASEGCDAILCDLTIGDTPVGEFISTLRDRGVFTPVVIITVNQGGASQDAAKEAGAVGLLFKPIRREDLIRSLADHLISAGRPPAAQQVTHDQDACVVEAFLEQLSMFVSEFNKARKEQDRERCATLSSNLAAAANQVRLAHIGELASRLANALEDAQDVESQSELIGELEAASDRVLSKQNTQAKSA